jgi:hypothetical protein
VHLPRTSQIRLFIPIEPPRGVTDWRLFPAFIALVPDVEGVEPADSDYFPAVWIGKDVTLMPPGGGRWGQDWPDGDYMAWAKIDASPDEIPVLRSGRVRIGGPGGP